MAAPKTGTLLVTNASTKTSQILDPTWRVEMAFGGIFRNRSWTDVTKLVREFGFVRGRSDEMQEFSTCSLQIVFSNRSGAFTPDYSPLVTPGRPIRIFCEHAGVRYQLCFGYVDQWSVEYPAHGKDAIAKADCTGVFTFLSNARSDTFLDAQYTTDRMIQMISEAGNIEIDIPNPGTIVMPEFELYETEVGSVVKSAAQTEYGQMYENRAGGIRFDNRGARFQQINPKITFGDDAAIEVGYEEGAWDYSQNKIFNRVTITADPDAPQTVIDLNSAATYGTKQFSMDIDAINGLNDAAFNTTYAESLGNFILGRYSEPALRINSIGLHPAGRSESYWDALLNLEINDRVVVNRRPPGYTPELTTTALRKTQAGLANAMIRSDCDPYGQNLALRTTTNGVVRSSVWSVASTYGTPAYAIVGDSGEEYFSVNLVQGTANAPNGLVNNTITMTHSFVPVEASKYYTLTAQLYGATATMATSTTPQGFRIYLGRTTYDANKGSIGPSAPIGGTAVSTTVAYTVVSIPQQTLSFTFLTGSTTAYIKPYIVLEFSDVTIPANTTVEFRFGSMRLHGPRASANFNGLTALTGGSQSIGYALTDPSWVKPYDIYGSMTTVQPSIGTRIERECFVEQIRYNVKPSNAEWTVGLGLSDAITGAFWVLDQSKLDIDTRLAI